MCAQLRGEREVEFELVGNGVSLFSHRHVVYDQRQISSLGMLSSGWSMSLCLLPLPRYLVRSRQLASLLATFFFVPMIFRSSFRSVSRLFSVFCHVGLLLWSVVSGCVRLRGVLSRFSLEQWIRS